MAFDHTRMLSVIKTKMWWVGLVIKCPFVFVFFFHSISVITDRTSNVNTQPKWTFNFKNIAKIKGIFLFFFFARTILSCLPLPIMLVVSFFPSFFHLSGCVGRGLQPPPTQPPLLHIPLGLGWLHADRETRGVYIYCAFKSNASLTSFFAPLLCVCVCCPRRVWGWQGEWISGWKRKKRGGIHRV